jgi:hypothetical protein
MDHPSNILNNNVKDLFAWKWIRYSLFNVLSLFRERVAYQKSLSKRKKWNATSESIARDFSPSHRDSVVNLELRKNHPLFVEYHLRSFKRG